MKENSDKNAAQSSRRTILKSAIAVGAAYFSLKYQKLFDLLTDPNDAFEKQPAIKEARDFLKKEYGIVVLSGETWLYRDKGEHVDRERYIRSLAIIVREVAKYPKSLFTGKGLAIRVADNLRVLDITNVSNSILRRIGGQTNSLFNVILFDAQTLLGPSGAQVVDHELYHLFDFRIRGGKSREWVELHEKVCRCNPYNSDETPTETMAVLVKHFGLQNELGALNQQEDRATWAEMLMNPEKHRRFLDSIMRPVEEFESYLSNYMPNLKPGQAEQFQIFMKKRYKEMLTDYELWSKGAMNMEFWARLQNGSLVLSPEVERILTNLHDSVSRTP